MKLEVKYISCESVDIDLFQHDVDSFVYYIEFEVGFKNKQGGDIFGFNVCNLGGLNNLVLNDVEFINSGSIALTGYFLYVLTEFDKSKIKNYIHTIVSQEFSSPLWPSIARELNKNFFWEYGQTSN